MTKNLLIRASAGTGKTYSIATRYLQLAAVWNVPCTEILALTFSRAAAQEIYSKIALRLVKAARDEAAAAKELALITEKGSLPPAPRFAAMANTPCRIFATILGELVESQHTGAIATLDSFILRLVRNFPLEIGFQNAISIIDDFTERLAIRQAAAALAATREGAERIKVLVETVNPGEHPFDPIMVVSKIAESGWRTLAENNPAAVARAPSEMMATLGLDPPDGEFLFALPEDFPAAPKPTPQQKAMADFAAFLATADGTKIYRGGNTDGRALAEHFTGPDAASDAWKRVSDTTGKTLAEYNFPHATAEAIRHDLDRIARMAVLRKLEKASAKTAAAAIFELAYSNATRRMGLLGFDDLSRFRERYAASLERDGIPAVQAEDAQAQALANLEYRLDCRFQHWALDEFQDTSEPQWASIKNLVENAATQQDKSVMAVGDPKQAIYAWRGGSDRPFAELMSMPAMRGFGRDGREIKIRTSSGTEIPIGEIADSNTSYRYGAVTCDFVNKVFGSEVALCQAFCAGRFADALKSRFLDAFREHTCAASAPLDEVRISLIGNDSDARAELQAPNTDPAGDGDDASITHDVLTFGPKVREILLSMPPEDRAETAILVRTNSQGRALEAFLRKTGDLDVTWEGAGALLESPAVNRILDVLRTAENPGDRFAANAVRLSRVFDGTPADVRRMLSRLGLARTIRRIAEGFMPRMDALSRLQVASLLRMAISYQSIARADATLADFKEYLASREVRTLAGGRTVRILSIHRSKGLTFNRAIVPVFETSYTDHSRPRAGIPFSGDGWAIDGLSASLASASPALAAAWRHACEERLLETLNLYYVAFTRHRLSLDIVLNPDTGPATISHLIRSSDFYSD